MTTNPASIDVTRHDTTAIITLTNPDAFNALAPDMIDGLVDACRTTAADRSCRAIVLTGAGDRAFCAGIDVKSVAARDAASTTNDELTDAVRVDPVIAGFENLHHNLSSMIRTLHTLPIPVIAAVNGHAIGAGFALAAACDLRIIGGRARFANGFVKRGISGCELGLSYFLPKLVGASVAFDWMLTGRNVDADEALTTGLASTMVEPDALLDTAIERAAAIAELAPMAVHMTKEVMWTNLNATSLDQALALESRTQALTRTTVDAAEARQSFLEKRAPVFGAPDTPRKVR